MSMTKEYIKNFVEEHKDDTILITCDNEHKFYYNAHGNTPVIWDWDNDAFIALETNQEIVDQNKHPMQVTIVALEEIQFLTAFIDINQTLEFIKEYVTDEKQKENVMKIVQKMKPAMMGPKTLRGYINSPEYK